MKDESAEFAGTGAGADAGASDGIGAEAAGGIEAEVAGGSGAGTESAAHRCGYVALIGRPNVGKSTLMNRLLSEKLAIVTPKPQTTRRKTLGILSGDGYQMILLDTPGLMDAKYDLHRAMIREAEGALAEADVAVYLTEPVPPTPLPAALAGSRARRVLVINKTDTARRKEELLPLLAAWSETGLFEELVPISALHGDGIDALLDALLERLPLGPPFYPPDQIAAQPERFFVGELIREQIFLRYREEVPYATEVEVLEFKERPEAKDYVQVMIYVEEESQKGILVGKGGAAIRALGEDARKGIELLLGRDVYLELRVRVLPKWRRRAESLRRLGYTP